ncbi:MAG: polyprenyl synthetase family protein [Anaerolineae bacterium]|nr:polyprenyl synthetase family protein [Anaerolineae bacterium]
MAEVETRLLEVTSAVPSHIAGMLQEIIDSGGKRLRPALVLLSAHLCQAPLMQAIPIAAAIEMLHTATLVHDDLIDGATLRRGKPTLNAHLSATPTVLAGDLLFARAAVMATEAQNLQLVRRFSATLEIICSGELNQFFIGRGHLPTHDEYERRIFSKTASLFALAMETGPHLAGCPAQQIADLARFGALLGSAFQITDDVLDFVSNEATLGKPVGSDLQQGLVTLPVLVYLQQHPEDTRLASLLRDPADAGQLQGFVTDLHTSGAIAATMAIADRRIEEALTLLEPFPITPYRRAIEEIATFAVRRPY